MEFASDISNSPSDQYRPSFFELAAQDQLRDLLEPVIRYLLSLMAIRYPRYWLPLSNRHEEVHAALMFAVERHYLTHWGGSFAENFYGLKRRRRPGVASDRARAAVDLFTDHTKLRKREIRLSLLFLVGIPYLRAKADDLYEQLGGRSGSAEGDGLFADTSRASSREPTTRRAKMKRLLAKIFKRIYPYSIAGYELLLLVYNLRYLFEHSEYWRPWLAFMRVDIRRMSAEDYRNAAEATKLSLMSPLARQSGTGIPPTPLQIIGRYTMLAPRLGLEALKWALPMGVFAFKFLEWWSSSEYSRRTRSGADGSSKELAIRAPPKLTIHPHPNGILYDQETGEQLELRKGQCPICKNELSNPTGLESSGWVFDYKCLYDYIEKFSKCPVTCLPSGLGDLRRIVG